MLPVIDRLIQQELSYRHYMADAMHCIGRLNIRYADIIRPKPKQTERSETEIIDHISDMLDKMEKANECI